MSGKVSAADANSSADLENRVVDAARDGDRNLLRALIRKGHSIERANYRGYNPLHEAAEACNIGCVRELLSKFGSYSNLVDYVNKRTNNGSTALLLAATKGHLNIVRVLLNAGGNINLKDNKGFSPLHCAVLEQSLEMINLLIEKGADVCTTDVKHQSCLHFAAAQGSHATVSILLPLCSLELRDSKGNTALYLAAKNGHTKCLEVLADAGACVNVQSNKCRTPLMAATKSQSESCVNALLERGADPNLVCCRLWPKLPIHVAAKGENSNILKRLVAVTDRAIDHRVGMVSPVYEAVDKALMLELLLNEGFSPDGQDCSDVYDVDSPLSLVLSYALDDFNCESMSDQMRVLITAGASVTKDSWDMCLAEPLLLPLLLQHRQTTREEQQRKELFDPEELRALQSVAFRNVIEADIWLPTLLKAGLEPSVLLLPDLLQSVESSMLNYLLEFVNWSTLAAPLRDILEQRLKQKTWTPHTHLECVPSLFHLCRLQLRQVLGSDVLMRTDVVEKLPVPSLLHSYLQFSDILPP
ncbi:ankyrin repeat and SOCS box protein 3-like [Polymixia lowei]